MNLLSKFFLITTFSIGIANADGKYELPKCNKSINVGHSFDSTQQFGSTGFYLLPVEYKNYNNYLFSTVDELHGLTSIESAKVDLKVLLWLKKEERLKDISGKKILKCTYSNGQSTAVLINNG